ncbi:MAG: hypothetical protein HYW86_02770 [Candidatus Roizmanbacteria bacterium]|nr:MAG: hypothetical protein HYW86_02770 [Candidatus Roizmanbacteria bacterium]
MLTTYCQTFKDRLAPLEDKLRVLSETIDEYIRNPTDEVRTRLDDRCSDIAGSKQKLSDDFQKKVIEILRIWRYQSHGDDLDTFTPALLFDDSQRVILKMDYEQPGNASYFPNIIKKIFGNTSFPFNSLKSLDYLEEVDGNLMAHNTNISSVKRLKKVGGNLEITKHSVCFDSLEEVAGFFGGRIKSAPKLKKAGHIYIQSNETNPFPSLEEIYFSCYINDSNLALVPNLRKVGRKLDIHNLNINDFASTFPHLQEVGKENESFIVSSKQTKNQILELKKLKKLKFDGDIKIID